MRRFRLPLAALVAAVLAALVAGCPSGDSNPAVTCPAGQTVCGSLCVDLLTDAASCGACFHACPSGGGCQAGTCACPAGQPDVCGAPPGRCVDRQTARLDCGACGTSCGEVGVGSCAAGACVCAAGATSCPDAQGAQCADLASDPLNCGACRHGCAAGESCVDPDADGLGTCACVGPERKVCPSGGGSACVDVWSNPAACGDCGVACATGASCSAGACACPAGQVVCAGKCVDLAKDPANCGACGVRCATGGSCSGGACACPGGQTPCGASPGTCTDLATDEAHCGTCATACAAGQSCTLGTCCATGLLACATGAGKACCAGTACCAGGCQTAHSAGIPPLDTPGPAATYYDCNALGTYTLEAARAAAAAWSPLGGLDADFPRCGGSCWARQTAHACATWCYSGNFVGRVALVESLACQCPTTLSPPWN